MFPLDALGIQSHIHAGAEPASFSQGLRELIGGARSLGLQVFITELDVNDDAVETSDTDQRDRIVAEVYRSYLNTALEAPRGQSRPHLGSHRQEHLAQRRHKVSQAPPRPPAAARFPSTPTTLPRRPSSPCADAFDTARKR